jgi:signal transduction histidine kinase
VRLTQPGGGGFGSSFSGLMGLADLSLVVAFFAIGFLVFGAVLRRREGAWSVGVSFLIFAACAGVVVFRISEDAPLSAWILAGILLPLAAMSYRLARSVSSVHQDLARRYDEVEQLSARLAKQNRSLELANIKIREGSHQVEEANRLKSAFLAHMSHDLRTPLNAIIGYTRILLRRVQGQIDERQFRNLENARVSADNLLLLINDILDLSRIESGRTEIHITEVDVYRLAEECAATVESLIPEGVELVCDLQEVSPVPTDGDRLRRILMNLLGNAVKYTEAGNITLRLQTVGKWIDFSVTDTGVGIPAADLPHIFDEFRQVDRKDKKREGSGLGLAIVRRSIHMLGGSVDAVSTVGHGSTFTVRLPQTPSPFPAVEPEDG